MEELPFITKQMFYCGKKNLLKSLHSDNPKVNMERLKSNFVRKESCGQNERVMGEGGRMWRPADPVRFHLSLLNVHTSDSGPQGGMRTYVTSSIACEYDHEAGRNMTIGQPQ